MVSFESGRRFSEAFLRPINHRASARFWNNERIFKSLFLRALSLRGTNRSFANQSLGMMKRCLKASARELTDCHATLAMTKQIVLISLAVGIMKGYLKAFAYGLCHCEARIGVSQNQSSIQIFILRNFSTASKNLKDS